MANTGREIVLTLKQIYTSTGVAVGPTKPNSPTDPNYIAPFTSTNCPVTYDTACPSFITTGGTGTAEVGFSLPGSSYYNPAVAKLVINLMQSTTVIATQTITFPHVNYFYALFSTLTAGTYTVELLFQNSSNAILGTCTGPSITVS